MYNKKFLIIPIIIPTFIIIGLLITPAVASPTATIQVDTELDELDGDPGNGDCSLREAIMNANKNNDDQKDCDPGSLGLDVIDLPAGTYILTITNSISTPDENQNATGDLDLKDVIQIIGDHHKTTNIQAGTGNPVSLSCTDCIDRVFDIQVGAVAEIKNVTIQYGRALDGDGFPGGDGRHAGGIYNRSKLTLIASTVINNRAGDGEDGLDGSTESRGGDGGGIFSSGSLEIIDSTIWENKAGNGGSAVGYPGVEGGMGGWGGGIFLGSGGVLTVTNTRVARNIGGYGGTGGSSSTGDGGDGGTGGSGGGIYSYGEVTITDSRIYENDAGYGGSGGAATGTGGNGGDGGNGGQGAGIFFHDNDGYLYLIDTAVTDNMVGLQGWGGASSGGTAGIHGFLGSGGGAYCSYGTCILDGVLLEGNYASSGGGIYNYASLNLMNTTVSGNFAFDSGGGISSSSSLNTFLFFVTVTNNTADSDSNGSGEGGGIFENGSGNFWLNNSLISGNTDEGDEYPDCRGVFNSNDYNLVADLGDGSCSALGGWGSNDLIGSSYNPGLAGLADNGGPTYTHALIKGVSDAIDHIPYGTNGCGVVFNTDQRGKLRVLDCDIGAFELINNLFLPLIMR